MKNAHFDSADNVLALLCVCFDVETTAHLRYVASLLQNRVKYLQNKSHAGIMKDRTEYVLVSSPQASHAHFTCCSSFIRKIGKRRTRSINNHHQNSH